MLKKILNTRNLREKVYKAVRDYIIKSEVPQGSKIDEDVLSKDLGVSKTPIREALSKLALEGIVEIIPNRGSFKSKLSEKDLYEVMLIREALEGLCVRLSALYIDEKVITRLKTILNEFDTKDLDSNYLLYPRAHQEFHSLIHQASKSPRLIRMIQSMYDLTHMLRLQYFITPEKVRISIQNQKKLIDALQNRNGDLAERLRKDALRSGYELMMKNLEVTALRKAGRAKEESAKNVA